jgi:hypothetical protein
MQLKEEANDKARKSKEKMKDYEAKVESMQGTLMQSSTNVLARVNELASGKEQASLAMVEQTNKNERLQSELDRVRKEMSDSLAEANVEITQRGAVLERKERMLAELQDTYDSVLDQMERASASAKEKIELQAERLMTVEASGSKEKSALAAQISQLRKEITLVKSDVQKTITALNSEIKYMAHEINQEQRLRDEAMKNKSGLEQSLMLAVQNAEKATRDKSLEMEQMSLQITKSNAAAAGESEKIRRLLLDLKEMSDSLNKADVQIKQRDDALRTKENEISGLQRDNQQLLGDTKKVKVSDIFSKSTRDEHLRDLLLHVKLLAVPLQDSVEDDALELIVKRNGEEEANKGMSTQSSKAGHQETKELAPGKERYRSLTARRGEGDKSSAPEKGKIVEGNVSGVKKRILPPKKTKYSSNAFISNGSGDKGITPDKEKGSQETYKSRDTVQSMVMVSNNFSKLRSTRSGEVGTTDTKGLSPQHHKIYNGMIFYLIIAVDLLIQVFAENLGIIDSTIWLYGVLLIATVCFDMGIGVYHEGKVENAMQSFKMTKQGSDVNDITNSGTGHFPVVATDVALASGCGVFDCISMCDSTTETILQCIWHKIYDGFIYLIITVDLLVHVFAANRGIADSTIRLFFALLIATACFNIGICIYHAGSVVENANTSYKTMEKKLDTKDCAISGTGLIAEESTSGALASNCDIFAPKSTHDLTTQTLCRCMWHKWLAFCVYNTSIVNFYAAYLTLNGCKKHVTALINTFFGWTGARMSTYVFETNECIANSFTAKFTAMKHTIIHVLSSASHLLVPHMTPVKLQRRRLFERRSSIIILAVVFIVSIIAETEGQQVSSQFYFVLIFVIVITSAHAHPHFLPCN